MIRYDLCVIGGGIHGAGIAADAAGRGLSVLLCEQADFGHATSTSTRKFFHGGLRSIENMEFDLVIKSIKERDILIRRGHYLTEQLQMVIPHAKHGRPAWLVKFGLFIKKRLSDDLLNKSQTLNLGRHEYGNKLLPQFSRGEMFSDCTVDDARLVMANVLLAKEKGAHVLPRTKCIKAVPLDHHWSVELECQTTGNKQQISATCLVNASGPWAAETLHNLHLSTRCEVIFCKGSHIILPRFYEGNQGYMLQDKNKRIVAVKPYLKDYCLVGTTATDITREEALGLSEVNVSDDEKQYLLDVIGLYFDALLTRDDIVDSFWGARALYDVTEKQKASASRDYLLDFSKKGNGAPLVSIFGGLMSTYRVMSEQVLELLKPYCNHMGSSWTAEYYLPGMGPDCNNKDTLVNDLSQQYPFLPAGIISNMAKNYGNLCRHILDSCTESIEQLGINWENLLFEKEVEYLVENEWALTSEDILMRRTKADLLLSPTAKKDFISWFEQRFPPHSFLELP